MRSGAASTSSMEHSSGSVFISQYFIFYEREKFPACGGGPGSRTLAKQGGRLPVTSGSSGKHPKGAGDDRNSDLDPQPEEAIGSEKLGPVAHRRKPTLF
jgi:hypothetical protein